MQQVNIYIKQDDYHNLVVGNVSEKDLIQMQFYHTDINLEKGVDNTILFSIRDHDRKKVTLRDNQKLVFTMVNQEMKQKLEKELGVIDASVGKYFILVTKDELNNFDVGDFKAHVSILTKIDDITTITDPTYSGNEWYSYFNVKVKKNDMDLIEDSIEKDDTDFNYLSFVDEDGKTKRKYTSSILKANVTEYHTAQVKIEEGFEGTIKLQGTLESDASSYDTDWIDLCSKEITLPQEDEDFNGNILLNAKHNVLWTRIQYIKEQSVSASVLGFTYRN